MRRTAVVPRNSPEDLSRWLVLESDPETGGVFVFVHSSLEDPCDYDHWYATVEEALHQAKALYGVDPFAWKDAL